MSTGHLLRARSGAKLFLRMMPFKPQVNSIIPILQMSKLTPKDEAHSQQPKVSELNTVITTKPNSLRNVPSLV